MNILIVKLGSIGDIVHTLPSLALIRRALPSSTISWVVDKKCAEILTGNSMIDHLIVVAAKDRRHVQAIGETLLTKRQQIGLLRASSFDLAIDFQGLLKSSFIARLSGAQKRFGFARRSLREPLSALFLTRTFDVPLDSHVIYKNLSLATQSLGLAPAPAPDQLEFPVQLDGVHKQEAECAITRSASSGFSSEFVILNPGGGWYTKLWSPERYGKLADEIWNTFQMRSIITYGPQELSLAEAIESSSVTQSAKGAELSLKGFCALAKKA
ncbi:MAG: glycosyltransferase family 9 protein, partial [Pyrinomonadaceae bacterium]